MRAGFYTADITPAYGMEMPGGYGKEYVSSIHDPLQVRAAVLDDGKTAVALVGIDVGSLSSQKIVRRVKGNVERITGIPGSHILMGASHTHAGGPLSELAFDDFSEADDLTRLLATGYSIETDPVYLETLVSQITTAICEAYRCRQEAKVSIGIGHEDQVSSNRRIRMKNGKVYTHSGKGNPFNLGYAGPMDPDVGVIAAWTPDDRFLGCIVNFNCHAAIVGGAVSADYIYYMQDLIRNAMGRDSTVVFLQGCCGDITSFNNLTLNEPEFGHKYGKLVGWRLGGEAIKVMATAGPGEHSPIAALTARIKVKRRVPSRDRVEASRRIVEEGIRTGAFDADWIFAKEVLMLDYMLTKEPEADIEVQVIQIGETVIMANPAELFCEFGLRMKKESRFPTTFAVSLGNGAIGYVPTADAFESDGGGYETVLTSFSNLEVQGGDMITDACLRLAGRLNPGVSPKTPDITTSNHPWAKGTPWDFGDRGPELE